MRLKLNRDNDIYIYIYTTCPSSSGGRGKRHPQLLKACPLCLVRLLHLILPSVLQSSHYYSHQTCLMVTSVWISSPSEFMGSCTSQIHGPGAYGYRSVPCWALIGGVRASSLFPCYCTGNSMCSR